jgi:hypothetical protein
MSLSGIRTYGLSLQAMKAYTSDRAATVTGLRCCSEINISSCLEIVVRVIRGCNERGEERKHVTFSNGITVKILEKLHLYAAVYSGFICKDH